MELDINIIGRGTMASDSYTYVRGAAFVGDSNSTPQALTEYFDIVESEDEFRSRVASLNGYFAVVCVRNSKVFAAVDRARSIPLFYSCTSNELYISDDASWVQDKTGSPERSEMAEYEFCMTGYVTGSDTLYLGVKQLCAGEFLLVERERGQVRVHVESYYDFVNGKDQYGSDPEELSREFDRVLVGCFDRLVALANGRTIVLPLSGGWDSRLIALMLTRLGYNNVIAFTYGRPGNMESSISRQVADSLGIEWHFVPYTNEAWRKWFWSEERSLYYSMAHNSASLPHIQDWPAVWELKKKELIPEDCVFVPGHTGDFLAGTTGIPKWFFSTDRISSAQVIDEIYNGHYSLFRCAGGKSPVKETMKERILTQLGVSCDVCPESAVGLYKRWVWRERQAKFIVNSVRVYEFWGHDWWIPLGDLEMRDLWIHVPLEFRIGRGLYIAHIKALAEQILGAEQAARLKSDREASVTPLKEFVKRTPFEALGRCVYGELDRLRKWITDYEQHSLAWYGIMDKRVFQRHFFRGNASINTYLTLDLLGKIDLL